MSCRRGTEVFLPLRFSTGRGTVVAVHNLSRTPRRARLGGAPRSLTEVFSDRPYGDVTADSLELDGHGYRWLQGPVSD